MSKLGRQRRTPEQRIAARESRSTVAYVKRVEHEARQEMLNKMVADNTKAQ